MADPPPAPRARRGWRAWLFGLHRDAGFLAVGLTLAYAVSGVATNHRRDWDYNRSARVERSAVGGPASLLAGLEGPRREALERDPLSVSDAEVGLLVAALGERLRRAGPPRNVFWRDPDRLSLFFGPGDSDTVDYHPSTGIAERRVLRDRWLLRSLNYLHLNEPGRAWTWVADAFAVVLAFLALSGALMARGRHALRGRGGVLALLGLALPVAALALFGRC